MQNFKLAILQSHTRREIFSNGAKFHYEIQLKEENTSSCKCLVIRSEQYKMHLFNRKVAEVIDNICFVYFVLFQIKFKLSLRKCQDCAVRALMCNSCQESSTWKAHL